MNISQAVGAGVSSVEFGVYTEDEIRRISVKEINNPVLLDNLGHPNPGGLYDLALGPYMGRGSLCATCKMDERFCPGHFGHIALPIPAYNPLFFSQMYHLLRAMCHYCHHFRLRRVEVHRYICKLVLLNAGLPIEAKALDNIHMGTNAGENREQDSGNDTNGSSDGDSDDEDIRDAAALMRKREKFVDSALARAGGVRIADLSSAVYEEKRKIIREFLKLLLTRKKCDNCGGISPTLRKDGVVTIFENKLNPKHQELMDALGKRRPNVLGNVDADGSYEASVLGLTEHDDTAEKASMRHKNAPKSRVISTTEARNHLRRLFTNEQRIMAILYGGTSRWELAWPKGTATTTVAPISADIFFYHYLAVTPTRFRPPSKMGDEVHENVQNDMLGKILAAGERIRDLHAQLTAASSLPPKSGSGEDMDVDMAKEAGASRERLVQQLVTSFTMLQHGVNSFIDSNRNPQMMPQGKEPPPGIKQILEKKEGLFRKHMMGKRVNYAARSVISPDPYIETNEIGVPPVFATKLTYPEPVTPYNVNKLRKAVINGPFKWPGASHIQNEDGSLIALATLNVEQRTALANQLLTPQISHASSQAAHRVNNTNKKVLRHLITGDMLILNRQPTLHKPSMMAHRARILPGEKTIRMHYANCNSYNADFDGDEMNMHFPQNEAARAEAMLLANTDSQYLVPTSGEPLRGLIQDHVVSGVWMTNKDTFFTRREYQQLVYTALRFDDQASFRECVETITPAIIKPTQLWTGKQVISTILLNLRPKADDGTYLPGINLTSKAKVGAKYWGQNGAEEAKVVFYDGELMCGVLDKAQYGASAYGMVHAVYEVWGASSAGKLLSTLGRLFTAYLQMRGFTCRMDDLRLDYSGDKRRRELLDGAINYGLEASRSYVGLEEGSTPEELEERLEEVLRDDEKLAGLDAAFKTKLAPLRTTTIDDCLPGGLLRQFPSNHMQTMTVSGAKGSNVNVSQISCLLGQQELEGRRVPLMVSGKSLPSFKPFDTSAKAGGFIAGRFLTGIGPQEYFFHCMAGREGLIDTAVKTSRSGYLQRCLIKHLEGIKVNYDNTVRDSDNSIIQFHYGEDSLDVTRQMYLKHFGFNIANSQAFLSRLHIGDVVRVVDTDTAPGVAKKALKKPHKYDPVMEKYDPSRYLGSVSEGFSRDLEKYIEENPDKLLISKHKNKEGPKISNKMAMQTKDFRALMNLQYQRALVQPGEMVGILASQSVGEPSTQMTLNTFHFAGFGAKNVTLGIPRLREIVMTASAHIQTPTMVLPIQDSTSDEHAIAFCKNISKLRMSEITDKVHVKEKIQGYGSDEQTKTYSITVKLYTAKEYGDEYNIKPSDVERVARGTFIKSLLKVINTELKKKNVRGTAGEENTEDFDIGRAVRPIEGQASASSTLATEADDGEAPDGDATDARMASKAKHFASYDGPDAEDRAIMDQDRVDSDSDSDESADEDDSPNVKLHDTHGEDDSDEDMPEYNERETELREQAKRKASNRERLLAIREKFGNIRDFDFDDANGEWFRIQLEYPLGTEKLLMVSLVEKACQLTVVQELPGITRAFIAPPASEMDTSRKMATEGVNFRGMWEFSDILRVDELYSNDIAAILRTYGVEAARNAIVQEVSAVFGVYGIAVDARHLSLIADYMTFEGGYKPFNRMGIESSVSPFAKMSFETTCHFLTNATLHGDTDTLHNPSASIVMGKVAELGTGSFDVLTPWYQ